MKLIKNVIAYSKWHKNLPKSLKNSTFARLIRINAAKHLT